LRSRKRSRKAGLPPGTLIHIGERKAENTRITLFRYDADHVVEKQIQSLSQALPLPDEDTITWINVDGLHEVEILKEMGDLFGLHPLALEDILNTHQRPKFEDYGAYAFLILNPLSGGNQDREIDKEQLSIVLGRNFVLTFQEREGDVFDPIRERIRSNKGRVRKMGADYLAYTLMDLVVDNYFVLLETLGEKIEEIEDALVLKPTPEHAGAIHRLKRQMIFLRRSVWPLREALNGLHRSESSLVRQETGLFLRDLYDHTVHVIDTVESFRDVLSGMLDIYLTSASNRMNEIMKVLTIIATIFIPLTFLVGVYGMNFEHMPELRWKWGYPLVWLVMICIGVFMLFQFRKKRWL